LTQKLNVSVLNVPTVFAQVTGDSIGSGKFRQHSRSNGVRLYSSTGLTDGGNMVNVDSKSRQNLILSHNR
jgi:hypothetical protein